MSAFETLLSGRYELRERVSSDTASSYWRAHDVVLARDVGIRVMPGSDSARAAAAGARRAAGAADPRLLQVLDVIETDKAVYVVSEWAPGRSLENVLLTDGPVPPHTALQITAELTAALTAAARDGLRHGALRPGSVIITEAGAVKVLGVGVDAPLTHREASERADVRGIGRILYACLTARWPVVHGPSVPSRLRGAPSSDSGIPSPRQVRAGVPTVLDELAARAIGLPPRSPLPTLDALSYAVSTASAALGDVAGPIGDRPVMLHGASAVADGVPPRPDAPAPNRWLAVVVGALLLTVLGLLAWQLATAAFDTDGTSAPPSSPSGSASATPSIGPLRIAGVSDFDPPSSGGNGTENPNLVGNATDGDPATAWRTMSYRGRPDLGGLKPGVGLIVDLGGPRDVTGVRVTLLGAPTTVDLRVAPQARSRGELDRLSDFRLLVSATTRTATQTVQLRPPGPLRTRFLLVWLTRLPPDGNGTYRGRIAEIAVTGPQAP